MRILLVLLSTILALPALAQQARSQAAPLVARASASPAFDQRTRELLTLLSGGGDYEHLFAPSFRAQVPKAKFDEIVAQLSGSNGPVGGVASVEMTGANAGIVKVDYRDAVATIRLVVDPAEPHQVVGLLISEISARVGSLEEATAAIQALHGTTGYALAKLGNGAPQWLAQHNSDRAFAVGSAFKLVILAELVRATNSGERKWDDLVALDGRQLPGGGYTTRPKGSQVSLRELATQMISISDNSATDILLTALGRDKVEAMLPVVGIADPARNRPFLGTLEAFKLKYLDNASIGRRYHALDAAGRRALLAGQVAATPLVVIPPAPPGGRLPALIDQIEWFFTPADQVRVMDWLRRNSEGPRGADLRAILSKNPGIGAHPAWPWIGFKGGSEPGVINLTLLLQARNGDWYALAASWNDSARAVEDSRFVALIERVATFAAPAP